MKFHFLKVIKLEQLIFLATRSSCLVPVSFEGSDTVSLIWLSVSVARKTCSSKGVSLIGIQ